MIRPALRAALALAASLPLFACAEMQPQPPLSPADQAMLNSCRSRADAATMRQSRTSMSLGPPRDSPYSASGIPGIPSTGLSQHSEWDQMVRNCVRSSGRTLGEEPLPETPGAPPSPAY
jgi:hypothetical protein